MENKRTGFWIRFAARILDLLVVCSAAVLSAYFMMDKNGGLHFKEDYLFYVWSIEFSTMLFIWFILIPVLTNGFTPFMWVCRIKIDFNGQNRWMAILKRELFYSVYWIFMTIFVATVINHTLIGNYAKSTQKGIVYSDWDKLRIGIVSSVGSILIVIQFIFSISIFVRGSKKGLHDTYSNTWTVWINKHTKEAKVKVKLEIKPRPVNNNPVEWVE